MTVSRLCTSILLYASLAAILVATAGVHIVHQDYHQHSFDDDVATPRHAHGAASPVADEQRICGNLPDQDEAGCNDARQCPICRFLLTSKARVAVASVLVISNPIAKRQMPDVAVQVPVASVLPPHLLPRPPPAFAGV